MEIVRPTVDFSPDGLGVLTYSSRGYPTMCKWMASDDDFFVIRKFGEVAARVLLRMQDRIAQLEERLQEQDRRSVMNGLDNGTFRNEKNLTRDGIMEELTWRLKEYRMPHNK